MKRSIILVAIVACGSKSDPQPKELAPRTASTLRATNLQIDQASTFAATLTSIDGVYGAMGIGGGSPAAAMLDVRSDVNVVGMPAINFREERNAASQGGVKHTSWRLRGTFASPTSTGISDGIVQWNFDGVNTGGTEQLGGLYIVAQDQAASASSTPMSYTWQSSDTSGTLRPRLRLDSAGHWIAPVATPPAATSCGATPSPTIAGSDVVGTVTLGGGATGCTITFNIAYTVANPTGTPHCSVTSQGGVAYTYSYSTSGIVIVAASGAGTAFDWTCIGY